MDDRDHIYFPSAEEVGPLAIAFAKMMFAHAGFEREVRSLQDAITGKEGFGEQRGNQWRDSDRGTQMVKLITKHHRHHLPQTEQIKRLLDEAVRPCRERNLLAHGAWWWFDRREMVVMIRGGVRWRDDPEIPPDNRHYSVADIEALAGVFDTLMVELYKLRQTFNTD
jgi:hypothetical protein